MPNQLYFKEITLISNDSDIFKFLIRLIYSLFNRFPSCKGIIPHRWGLQVLKVNMMTLVWRIEESTKTGQVSRRQKMEIDFPFRFLQLEVIRESKQRVRFSRKETVRG